MSSYGSKFKGLDLFVKIPTDLTEATTHGFILSISAVVFMVTLFFVEFSAFLTVDLSTKVAMDMNMGSQLRVNFNITIHDLHCDFVEVNLRDAIGTRVMNVTPNVEKWQLDSDGVRRMYQGRNRRHYEIDTEDHHPHIDVLHENGEHAIPLDTANFEAYTKEHEFTFVDFYAPWCIWCQRLAPVWEVFAEEIEKTGQPVVIAKVDCVAESALCARQKIQAFPTLRFFRHEEPVNQGDYRSDRTVQNLLQFVTRKLDLESQYKEWPDARKAHAVNWNTDHPGCLVSGFLLVNRVPGNFHIMAYSKNHNLNTAATNLSLTVNHLSFGIPLTDDQKGRLDKLDVTYHQTNPLDAKPFIVLEQHKAYHHYIKIVPTNYELGKRWRSRFSAYQLLSTDQVMEYNVAEVPQARFAYDISPMAVVVRKEDRKWYDFLTSLCGIIGGTFTVVGLIDGFFGEMFKGGRAF